MTNDERDNDFVKCHFEIEESLEQMVFLYKSMTIRLEKLERENETLKKSIKRIPFEVNRDAFRVYDTRTLPDQKKRDEGRKKPRSSKCDLHASIPGVGENGDSIP